MSQDSTFPSSPLRVAVLFGGRSGEHQVSCTSALAVIKAMQQEPKRYEVFPIGISREGQWFSGGARLLTLLEQSQGYRDLPKAMQMLPRIFPDPGNGGFLELSSGGEQSRVSVDLVFPVLHGPQGEDGTVQGLLELVDLPYVGCKVLASALAMDKVAAKSAFKSSGLSVLPWVDFSVEDWHKNAEKISRDIEEKLGFAVFVKPANMGSSVGISKVTKREDLAPAVQEALRHDRKILVEKAASNFWELECAVLGKGSAEASVVGEIRPVNDFYDYDAKYIQDGSELVIPAAIPEKTSTAIRDMALRAFAAIDGSGLSRVDFLAAKDGSEIWINEINTLPGFTPISMYPKLWQASGLNFSQLIDRLIQLAVNS